MCFNPAKSWQLGWYSEQHETILVESFKTYTMVGVVDYDSTETSKKVIVKIENGPIDYFIGYNRAKDFNAGTKEAGNQIVIVQQGAGYSQSDLMAKLAKGQEKELIVNYQNTGKNVIVRYRANTSAGTDEAIVDVFLNDCDPMNGGCKGPTPAPTPTSNNDQCPVNQELFTLELTTDNFGGETEWSLTETSLGTELKKATRGTYAAKTDYTDGLCLQQGKSYKFTITDSFGDGICCKYGNGKFIGKLKGNVIFQGGSFTKEWSQTFTVGNPATPTPAPVPSPTKQPTPSPTKPPTKQPTPSPTTKPPTNAPVPQTSSIVVEIQTDYWAGETTWRLYSSSGQQLMEKSGYNTRFTTYVEAPIFVNKNQCVTFTILDTFGDGLIVGAMGGYKVKVDGVVVEQGRDFGYGETKIICPK